MLASGRRCPRCGVHDSIDTPGSLEAIQVVVADADAALAQLRELGIAAEGVDEQDWGRFVTFADPDGNRWTLQQLVPYD